MLNLSSGDELSAAGISVVQFEPPPLAARDHLAGGIARRDSPRNAVESPTFNNFDARKTSESVTQPDRLFEYDLLTTADHPRYCAMNENIQLL